MTKLVEYKRVVGWEKALAEVVNTHLSTPGVWGTSDCLLTTFDAVFAIIGIDPGEDIRGKYNTAAGAQKLLLKRGFADVEEGLASLFKTENNLMAKRGDVGVIVRDGQRCAGFVCDRGFAVKTEQTGLIFVDQSEMRSAYKVG